VGRPEFYSPEVDGEVLISKEIQLKKDNFTRLKSPVLKSLICMED
jgi:hypothetical protein